MEWSNSPPETCFARPSKAGTEVGLKAKALMDAGELVPDEVVSGIIGDKLDESGTLIQV